MNRSAREPLILLGLAAVALVVSGIHPHDRFTWFLEVFPIFIGVPILIATATALPADAAALPAPLRARADPDARRALHLRRGAARLLGAGRCWTSRATTTTAWATSRRASCPRSSPARSCCGGRRSAAASGSSSSSPASAWPSARATNSSSGGPRCIGGSAADAFLGTQGDVWDTQWDMFIALIGAMTAQLLLAPDARPADRAAGPQDEHMMTGSAFEAILFDCDGVVLDSETSGTGAERSSCAGGGSLSTSSAPSR